MLKFVKFSHDNPFSSSWPCFCLLLVDLISNIHKPLSFSAFLLPQTPSTLSHARVIIKKGGLGVNGLYKGLGVTLIRHGSWNCVYFGFYHNLKIKLLAKEVHTVLWIEACPVSCTCMNKRSLEKLYHSMKF